jgi:hypothetical protein
MESLPSGEGFALKCEGKLFKKVKLSFTHPFQSKEIGNYQCEEGLGDKSIKFDFAEITHKCFMFPMKMPSIQTVEPSNKNQTWICQFIKHSDLF